MQRSNIEWCDYVWNPVTGCSYGCRFCYARRFAQRLRGRSGYPLDDPFRPTYHTNRITEPLELKSKSRLRIFTCSMGDLFDEQVASSWVEAVLQVIEQTPKHDFLILTKQPENIHAHLHCMGIDHLPPNLWLGVSVTDTRDLERLETLKHVQPGGHRFVSFEPIQGQIYPQVWQHNLLKGIEWALMGAETGNSREKITPRIEWIEILCGWLAVSGVPKFMKNNLKPVLDEAGYKRVQKYPEGLQRRSQ